MRPIRGGAILGRPADDMRGKRLNGCLFVERAPSVTNAARWRCLAACGHEVLAEAWMLRQREKLGYEPYFCRECSLKRTRKPRLKTAKAERASAEVEHARPTRRAVEYCSECCNLPHRRPEVGLCRCGKAYEAESTVGLLATIMDRRIERRVY